MAQQVKIAGVTYNDVPSILVPDSNGVFHPFVDQTSMLEYETGTWSPSENTSSEIIYYSKTHDDYPIYLMFVDMTGTDDTTSNTSYSLSVDNYVTFANAVPSNVSSVRRLATATIIYRGSNGTLTQSVDSITATSGSTPGYLSYWVDKDKFRAYSGSSSRYWRTGRTYKWIAIFKPTS